MSEHARWETPWSKRPAEEANNLNPAYCGELLVRTMTAYIKAGNRPLSLALCFLVLPIVLHKATRDALPGNASAALLAWAADKAPMLVDLPDRASRLSPVTREALLFLSQVEAISFKGAGIQPGPSPLKLTSKNIETTDDVNEARSAAALLGRWFAAEGNPPAILQAFGVTP